MAQYRTMRGLDDPIQHEGDSAFMRLNARLRPNQLKPGEVAISMNGRMETDGTWQVREGIDSVSGVLAQSGTALLVAPTGTNGTVYMIPNVAISAAARVGTLVTVTCAAHGLPSGNTSVINVFINDGSVTVNPDGNKTVTRTSATQFTYVIDGATGSETYTPGASPLARSAIMGVDTVVDVHGSCIYSDPKDANAEWIIIATTTEARAFDLTAADIPGSVKVLAYPAGITLSGRVDMIQALDYVTIFREGATAIEFAGDVSTPGAFVKVASGAKTQHKIFTAATNTAISAGVVTVTEGTHGLAVGDTVEVVTSSLDGITEGESYRVATVPGSGSFTFFAAADDASSTSIVYSTAASLGGGYICMPGGSWGVYHQRRIFMPFTHTSAASPATRNVTDELIASDILDRTTFDPIGSQFRLTAGTSDYLVNVHPFDDDRLVAFNRNSVHVLSGISGSLDDVKTTQLTGEIGCAARKSVVGYGNTVFFLSDSGVYGVTFIDAYNLRGAEMPLSEAIQPWIDRINKEYMHNAVGVYHDNRYYLFVPLDDSTQNDTTLVYNIINQGWESVDTVSSQGWDVLAALPAQKQKKNLLYVVTTQGGIHQVTDTARNSDEIAYSSGSATSETVEIAGQWRSRQYDLNTMNRKKWSRYSLHVKSDDTAASEGNLSAIIEDPDQTATIGTLTNAAGGEMLSGEAGDIRGRLGNSRGYGIQLDFLSTSGRPVIRAAQVEGSTAYTSTTSTR